MPQKQQSSARGAGGNKGRSQGRPGGKAARDDRAMDRSEKVSLSPLSDLEFDVISVLYQKAKALEAYDKYLDDAGASDEIRSVLEKIRRDDAEHVRMLRDCVGALGLGSDIEA